MNVTKRHEKSGDVRAAFVVRGAGGPNGIARPGCGFIELVDEDAVARGLQLDGAPLDSRVLRIERARGQ